MNGEEAILITGCGRGLGLALAKVLAVTPYRVFAGLRDMADADNLPASVVPLALDVTNKQHIADALHKIEQSGCVVKALVNNAGLHVDGPVECVPEANVRRVFEVNFFGMLAVTRAFLPLMRRQKGGQILMLSSLSGLIALPGDGIYAASKYALEAVSESLAIEVEPWNINVTLLEPGAYATDLLRAGDKNNSSAIYAKMLPDEGGPSLAPPALEAAIEIASLIENPTIEMRHAIGDQAREILPKIQLTPQQARRDFILSASGAERWVQSKQ